MTPPGTLVKVAWMDSWATDMDDGDMEPIHLEVVGFVIAQTKSGIKLAMERSLTPGAVLWRRIHFIPTCNIIKIRKLARP